MCLEEHWVRAESAGDVGLPLISSLTYSRDTRVPYANIGFKKKNSTSYRPRWLKHVLPNWAIASHQASCLRKINEYIVTKDIAEVVS